MTSSTFRRLWAALVLAGVCSCGGDNLVLPNEGEPAEVVVVRGDRQNGTVGQRLPDSLVVRVTDRFGNAVPGVEVIWVPDNGGSVSPDTSATDAAGRAATSRILGGQPGTYTTRVTVAGFAGEPVIFVTTGLAAKISFVTQPGAIATSGTPLDPQPLLQLTDPDGNPIAQAGVSVSVQIASGGGSLEGGTTSGSDASGRVAFTDLAIQGSPGVRTLIFAADAFASAISTPIALGVGAPASMELVAGDGQTGVVGTDLPILPAVVVKDGNGNPVAGVPVNFVVRAGGGTLAGEDPVTGADGIATVGRWTLGTTAGTNTLEAGIGTSGVAGNPVVFHATAQAGGLSAAKSGVAASPATITASTGSSSSTITVTARDEFSNPLAGVAVVIAATGSGNTLVQPAGPTNAQGVVTGQFSSTGAGSHVVSATVNGTAVTQTRTVTVTSGPPTLDKATGEVGTGTAGSATTITIRLKDEFDNPATGAAARLAVTVQGANSASGGVTEAGGGAYTFSYTPLVTGTDQISVLLDGAGIPGSPFSSTVSAGPADAAHTTASVPGSFVFATTFTVTARDAQNNLLARGGDVVAMTVQETGVLPVTDNADGTYSAFFAPGTTGTYHVDITINGVAISGSPFTTTRVF
jgi:invasin-like protein/filamin/ABP280 repeat protein/Big-like domain-containing protein